MSDIRLKVKSFGGCTFSKMSPPVPKTTPVINFTISFEEALKLGVAVEECIRKLNSYNRATARGKSAALALIISLEDNKKRIRVQEGKVNG